MGTGEEAQEAATAGPAFTPSVLTLHKSLFFILFFFFLSLLKAR